MEQCVPVRMLSDFKEVMQSVGHEAKGSQGEITMGCLSLVIEEEQLSFSLILVLRIWH